MRLHRTHRDAENLRDFLVLASLQMIQRDDAAILLRQRVNRGAQPLSFVTRYGLALRARRGVRPFGKFLVGIAFAAPEAIATGVIGDRKKPGRELGVGLEGSQAAI